MFHHLGLTVSDLEKSVQFYQRALEPLGLKLESHDPEGGSAGLGKPGAPQLWLNAGKKATVALHLAFSAPDKESVKKFHAAAIKAGGKDNGPAGPRPSYGEHYYAAFVFDPDGNNVEAVCMK